MGTGHGGGAARSPHCGPSRAVRSPASFWLFGPMGPVCAQVSPQHNGRLSQSGRRRYSWEGPGLLPLLAAGLPAPAGPERYGRGALERTTRSAAPLHAGTGLPRCRSIGHAGSPASGLASITRRRVASMASAGSVRAGPQIRSRWQQSIPPLELQELVVGLPCGNPGRTVRHGVPLLRRSTVGSLTHGPLSCQLRRVPPAALQAGRSSAEVGDWLRGQVENPLISYPRA